MALAVISAIGLATVTAASTGQATTINYCGSNLGPYATCQGPLHSLNGNYVNAGFRKCSGAKDQNGNFYGSYICAISGQATHCYSGNNLLYGMAHNGHDGYQTVYGQEAYNAVCPP